MLVGACQFGTTWAGLRLNSFIHWSWGWGNTLGFAVPLYSHAHFLVFYVAFWVLAGACQRHGVGGSLKNYSA